MTKFPEESPAFKMMEWIDGAADCRHGRPFEQGRSEHYETGWDSAIFNKEQKPLKISELGELL